MNKLSCPTMLKENILVDVVFEIRFNAKKGFSNLVPGIAHKLFGDNAKIDNYPIYDLPPQVRESNPDLKYQPIIKIEWDNVVLMVGDSSLGIGYGTNYPGWNIFKSHIQSLIESFEQEDIFKEMINSVERYSFKYVDFIPENMYSDLDSPFLVSAMLGSQDISSNDKLRLQLESSADFGSCLFDFNKPVQAIIDNKAVDQGTLIITDTLRNLTPSLDVSKFLQDLETYKDKMHLKNKNIFFQALSQDLLNKLGAQYD